jgi:stage II sporulation protein AA (anti-sigma F factor antagonist)
MSDSGVFFLVRVGKKGEKNMQHSYEKHGIQMIYHMPREVDQHVSEEIREFLEQMILSGSIRELVFDFAETEFMDSSGIGIVIGRCRTLGYYSGTVYVANASERVDKLFRASGVYKIVKKKETR